MEHISTVLKKLMTDTNQTTAGDYESETAASGGLAHCLLSNDSGLFGECYREVRGQYRRVPPGADPSKGCRIDFVVSPSLKLMEMGWRLGPIFIEVKRSNTKIGKVIVQCIDYRNAVFEVAPGFWVEPQWIFIFPLSHPAGDIASVMAHNCVGNAEVSPWQGLKLMAGSQNVLIEKDEHTSHPPCGRKLGSR